MTKYFNSLYQQEKKDKLKTELKIILLSAHQVCPNMEKVPDNNTIFLV
tara:strand:+ start:379 stop:522 length:144 start_codon:yes stop_codon:yes gene_type:complete